jgi:hypothetical protein
MTAARVDVARRPGDAPAAEIRGAAAMRRDVAEIRRTAAMRGCGGNSQHQRCAARQQGQSAA